MKPGVVCRAFAVGDEVRVHDLGLMTGRHGRVVGLLERGERNDLITPEGWWQVEFPALGRREIMRAHLRYVPRAQRELPFTPTGGTGR